MSEEKTIRCTKCYEEFSEEETKNVSCCPKCGCKGLPMSIELVVDDWIKVDKARGVWNSVKDPMKLRQMMGAQMAFAKLFNCYMAWGQYQCLRKRGFGPN